MTIDPQKTIFLIDASSYLYRAYYSIKSLHAPDGTPVNAVYGFCRMLKKLLDTFEPQYCALIWDSKGKTGRHEAYPAYKATFRKKSKKKYKVGKVEEQRDANPIYVIEQSLSNGIIALDEE